MRALPSGIFRILCRQRNIHFTYNSLKITANPIKVETGLARILISPGVNEAISVIQKYPLPIPWGQVIKELAEYNEDIHNVILKGCSQLKDADIVMSYYKYVIDKGEDLTRVNLFMIINTLSECSPSKIIEHEELLIYLFHKCKEFISSTLFQNYAVQLFSYIPQCYRELIQMPELSKKDLLISRAFDFDKSSVAWKLLEGSHGVLSDEITKSFINYCIRQALMNKFSIDLINKYINLCQRKGLIIHSNDILCSLQPLIHVLIHCQNDYIWSVKKCTINPQMECLNCSSTLKEVKMSEDEFEILRNAVFRTLIPSKDIFLKTSLKELKKFKYFLSTCEPFDMVVDGLNYMYRGIQSSKKKVVARILENYLMEKKKKVLIITRKHFQGAKFFKDFKNAQIFYTENSSDDDVFILCAAMHGGLGTNILTSDFLGTHAAKLSSEIKTLFIKWQLCHQYIIDPKLGVILPSLHMGLPQCTISPEMGGDSYKWHLSYQEKHITAYSFRLNFEWVCLQAIPARK